MPWNPLDYTPLGLGIRAGNYLASLFADDPKPKKAPPKPRARTDPRRTPAPTPTRTTTGRQRVPVQTKREAIQETARRVAAQRASGAGDFATAWNAGVRRGLFGIPERLAAAGLRYLPSSLTGNTSNASYDDILALVRATTDEELKRSTGGNIFGQIVGGVAGGGAAAGAAKQLLGRAVAAGLPGARAAQTAVALQRGQKLANTARISAAGAAGAAAQAAGEGRDDIGTQAALGAVAAPAVVGGAKVAEYLSRPVRDLLRTSTAGGILRRFTSTTLEELQSAAERFRQATGTEPTAFELLPLKDRRAIIGDIVGPNATVAEQAAEAIQRRASNVGPEMSARVEDIVRPQRSFIERGMADDLAAARGGAAGDEAAVAAHAASDPTDMLALRSEEAGSIMAPFDDQVIFRDIGDLIPATPRGSGGSVEMVPSDPELANIIRNAAGTLRLRDNGITVREVTGIMEKLRGVVARGGNEGNLAQRAINHIEDTISGTAPEVGDAVARMNAAFAGRSRMAEGMREGVQSRTREQVQVGTSTDKARTVRNAYDTPEGSAGRVLGQSNRLAADLNRRPEEVLRATQDIANSGDVQRALAANLGDDAARLITEAAEAQERSVRALASASREAQKKGLEDTDLDKLGTAIVALNPTTFASTRIWALRRLVRMTHIPEDRARQLVDLLFSQNPTTTRRALELFDSGIRDGKKFTRELATAVTVGQQMAADRGTGGAPDESAFSDTPAAPDQVPAEEGPWNDFAEPPVEEDAGPWSDYEGGADASFGESAVLSVFPEAEITDALRDPNSKLGRSNMNSYHVRTNGAVDVRPIPGMTFEEFVQSLRDAGYEIAEAIDEVKHPSSHATGPHWHVAFK